MSAVDSAKHPDARALPDRIHRVERAGISKNDELLILFVGSVTNSPRNSHYTLTVPLAQMKMQPNFYSWCDTNGLRCGAFDLPRSALKEGWPVEKSLNGLKPVPLGSPITPESVYPNGTIAYETAVPAKLLPNSAQSLFQVHLPYRIEFIFVDASDVRANTDFRVTQVLVTPRRDWGYYFLLPVTIPLDIATAPIQIPFYFYMRYAFRWSGC